VVGSLQSTWVGPLDRRGEGQKTTTLVSAMSTTGESIYACGKGSKCQRKQATGVVCADSCLRARGSVDNDCPLLRVGSLCLRPFSSFLCVCKMEFPRGAREGNLGCDAKISREGSHKVIGLINQYVCNDGESPCRAANAFIACRRKGG
jgi:hypothetical protein